MRVGRKRGYRAVRRSGRGVSATFIDSRGRRFRKVFRSVYTKNKAVKAWKASGGRMATKRVSRRRYA